MGRPLSPYFWQIILISWLLLLLFQRYGWNWMWFFYSWLFPYFLCLLQIIFTQLVTIDVQLKVFELHVNLVVIQLFLPQKVVLQGIFCFVSCDFDLYLFSVINRNWNLWNPFLEVDSSFILLPFLFDFFIGSFQ